MIFRSEHFYVPQLPLEDPDWPPSEVALRRFGPWGTFAMPLGFVVGVEARAFVNWSQWQTLCPWCRQPQLASPADPRLCCPACHNDGRSQWVRVVFPDDREEIEAALNRRPRLENRNWLCPGHPLLTPDKQDRGETLADLEAENALHEVA